MAADERAGTYVFEYEPKWPSSALEQSPLHLSTAQAVHRFPWMPAATYFGLPAMLADALPDDFGNALIDAYLARQGVHKSAISALARLSDLGKRGMGALLWGSRNRGAWHRPTTSLTRSIQTALFHTNTS